MGAGVGAPWGCRAPWAPPLALPPLPLPPPCCSTHMGPVLRGARTCTAAQGPLVGGRLRHAHQQRRAYACKQQRQQRMLTGNNVGEDDLGVAARGGVDAHLQRAQRGGAGGSRAAAAVVGGLWWGAWLAYTVTAGAACLVWVGGGCWGGGGAWVVASSSAGCAQPSGNSSGRQQQIQQRQAQRQQPIPTSCSSCRTPSCLLSTQHPAALTSCSWYFLLNLSVILTTPVLPLSRVWTHCGRRRPSQGGGCFATPPSACPATICREAG